MDFLKKLFGGSSVKPETRYYAFAVKCRRCGEVITARMDLLNDLSIEYAEGGDVYYARKTLMGENKCFQRVEVELKFNAQREVFEKHATGGEFTQP